MSLIVGYASPSSLYAVADTKLTDPAKVSNNPYIDGIAKLVILDDRRFVGFSGSFGSHSDVLRGVHKDWSDEELVDVLQGLSAQGEVDYLFGTLGPPPSVLKFAKGTQSSEAPWIGDCEAFDRFQGYRLGELKATVTDDGVSSEASFVESPRSAASGQLPDVDEFSKMFAAMKNVIHDGEVASVSGFVLPVLSDRGQIRYGTYFQAFFGPIQVPSSGGCERIGFGDVTTGAFSVNFGPTDSGGCVAFIDEGELGIFFHGETISERLVPQLVHGDEIDVDEALRQACGAGLPFTRKRESGHYYVKAEKLTKSGNMARAHQLVSLGIEKQLREWSEVKAGTSPPGIVELLGAKGLPTESKNLTLALSLRSRIRGTMGDQEGAMEDLSNARSVATFSADTGASRKPQ